MTPRHSPSDTKPEEQITLVSSSETEPEAKFTHHQPLGLSPVPETETPIIPQLDDYDPSIDAKPYSPFYRHATPSYKLERLSKKSRSNSGTSPIDDAGGRLHHNHAAWQPLPDEESGSANNNRRSKGGELCEPKKRRCDRLRGLPPKQRALIKAALAIVILGSMVAIALGITAAVGGGVWKSDHRQEEFRG